MKRIAAILLATLAITGCASRASSVVPLNISSSTYTKHTCEQLNTQLNQKRAEQAALTSTQNKAATGDAIGVFLVLLPVGSIIGDDVEGELSKVKGEVIALEGAFRENGCS